MAAITQRARDGVARLVALVSRGLMAYKAKQPPLEQQLHIARWALFHCRRFTTSAPNVHIHIPELAHVLFLTNKQHHLQLEALLVDLAGYQATYGQGDQLQQLWVEALYGASKGLAIQDNEEVELPILAHEAKTIAYPVTSRPLPAKIGQVPHWTAFLDGGAAKKLGREGFIVFRGDGTCAKAQANYYGSNVATNNRAEARALEDLMTWLAEHRGEW